MTIPLRGPLRDDALQGKRILITGGGTGLGKELARSFVAHGASVHICGRRETVLQDAVAELRAQAAHGGSIEHHLCDVRSAEQMEAMVERIWQGGALTGLVNNAAANFISPSIEISPRGFEAVRSTVMDGALYATLACGRRWIAQGLPGSVVSMLVTWVWTGSPFVLPSVMAKTAVHAMTMSLAVEWGRHNIRVNAVAPGPFPTESAWEKLAPIPKANVGAASSEKVPMGCYGQMDELCTLLMFLQSDGLRLPHRPEHRDRRRPPPRRAEHLRRDECIDAGGLGRGEAHRARRRRAGEGAAQLTIPGLPLVLFGHSMGSFAVQQCLLDHREPGQRRPTPSPPTPARAFARHAPHRGDA